jgi:hypothetical protein
MPWTAKQNKLFRAAEHNPAIAKSAGIPQATAKKLAHEGVIGKPSPKQYAKALRGK